MENKKTLHRIIVVGGGAGGLELAARLGNKLGKKQNAKITLGPSAAAQKAHMPTFCESTLLCASFFCLRTRHMFQCKPLLFDRCQTDNVDTSHRCLIDNRMDGLASSMCLCRHTLGTSDTR